MTGSEIPWNAGGHRTVNRLLVREFQTNVGLRFHILRKIFGGRIISMQDAVSDVTGRITRMCSNL